MIPMEERKALRKKTAFYVINKLRLRQRALAGEFDDLTDEEFAEKLDIVPANRTAFIKMLQEDPTETAESIREFINLYIIGEISDEVFLQKLSALEFVESYYADANEGFLEPEDYRAGTLDILRRERRGFHTFSDEIWEAILKIAEAKNVPVYPIDREKRIDYTNKKIAI